jgi:hypothetical protein
MGLPQRQLRDIFSSQHIAVVCSSILRAYSLIQLPIQERVRLWVVAWSDIECLGQGEQKSRRDDAIAPAQRRELLGSSA